MLKIDSSLTTCFYCKQLEICCNHELRKKNHACTSKLSSRQKLVFRGHALFILLPHIIYLVATCYCNKMIFCYPMSLDGHRNLVSETSDCPEMNIAGPAVIRPDGIFNQRFSHQLAACCSSSHISHYSHLHRHVSCSHGC